MSFNINLPDVAAEIQDLNKGSATVKIVSNHDFYSAVTKRLRPYKSMPYQFKPALEKVADTVRTQLIPRVFKEEGPGWAPLARMTIGRRIAAGFEGPHPILVQTGDLFDELTNKSHPKHIEIIKTGRVARIEIGGSSAKFIENQMGIGRIPARPMIPGTGNKPHIPLSQPDRKMLQQVAMQELITRIDRTARAVG